jgi:hypothetical protein
MRIFAVIGLLLVAGWWLPGQGATYRPVVRSASGQFAIYDRRGVTTPALPGTAAEKGFYELEPAILAVSCERIKGALNAELGLPRTWRSRIQLTVTPVRRGNDDYAILLERFRDGWTYRVNLPQRVERAMFVRTLLQALLLEHANRQAGERSAEIPLWLLEGLTQHLLATREAEMVLSPPALTFGGVTVGPTVIQRRENDSLAAARTVLRDRAPLTIEELSWPQQVTRLDVEGGEFFRRSAQLFVWELLRLPNGRECLRDMLSRLAGCYNWQTAFLAAFQMHFPNQLALEKWWALQATYFVGRSPAQLWTVEESRRQLNEVLRTPVAIRNTLGELPARAEISLQVILREWDTGRQRVTLQDKAHALDMVRVRVAPELMALTDDYRRVLAGYLRLLEESDAVHANLRSMPSGLQKAAMEAIGQLDELDARRAAARTPSDAKLSAAPAPGTR